MRLLSVAVLAATALVAIAEGTPTSVAKMAAPNLPALVRSFTAAQHDAPIKRMLRTNNPYEVDEKEEERAFGNGFLSTFKSWSSKIKLNSDLRGMLKNQQTADKALVFLKLDGGVDDILSNPNLKYLAKYISMYSKKFPDTGVTMAGTLVKRYGDDAVAAMLVAGQRSLNTKDIAENLQGELFRLWHHAGKSYSDVFRLLKLEEANNPLKGDVYQAWQSYFTVYNNHAPLQNQIKELNVLTDIYGERGFAALLQKVKWDEDPMHTAMTFQRELFDSWVSKKVSPKKLFEKIFKLEPKDVTRSDKGILSEYTDWWNAAIARSALEH
ncbi:putative secreted RxLR effector protein [Phytophthora cinnamomi]|uniref:putative secreted RxLR effector protein n=1 Tax=Phytophthora cinnamomi TaxID=4785 RepID=UPI002A3255DD|nr:putative secreted RxLR effector protein [Phytophthora cinnamomi]KAJ8578136.1 hypothetical protein ON010_g1072 [Phytophthora cinnamomi]